MSERHVAVLLGGPSSEHEISIQTGEQVIAGLDRSRYRVSVLFIDRDSRCLPIASVGAALDRAQLQSRERIDLWAGFRALKVREVDVVFNALHGRFGEDGRVQAVLEALQIPCTGSGVTASAVAMDKRLGKLVARAAGVPVAAAVVARSSASAGRELGDRIERELGFPCILKPNTGGSSVGLALVQARSELDAALRDLAHSPTFEELLVERFLVGDELTVGVLGDGAGAVALPPILIKAVKSRLFDYEAKYQPGMAAEICPAPIASDLTATVQRFAVAVHEQLDCRGVTRSDFIVVDNVPHFLEINTLPGLTRNSLVPKAARVAGISFPELLDRLLDGALKRRTQ
ncbi:MAG: D-alanine--D-alanine ligase [Planctomycetota bacterium]